MTGIWCVFHEPDGQWAPCRSHWPELGMRSVSADRRRPAGYGQMARDAAAGMRGKARIRSIHAVWSGRNTDPFMT